MDDLLGIPTTLTLLVVFSASFLFILRLERRPAEFGKVRLIPPTFLLILCSVAIIVMLARLLAEMAAPSM